MSLLSATDSHEDATEAMIQSGVQVRDPSIHAFWNWVRRAGIECTEAHNTYEESRRPTDGPLLAAARPRAR